MRMSRVRFSLPAPSAQRGNSRRVPVSNGDIEALMYRFATVLLASWMLSAQTDTEWLNRGVQAFKSAKYREAVQAFQRAVDANPGNVTAHVYLGTAEMQQYIPGAETAENALHADRADAEFRRVLELEPANKTAMASIA